MPELAFRFDESIAHQERIEQILRDLPRGDAARRRAASEATRDGPRTDATPMTHDARLISHRAHLADEIRRRQRFVLTSHARPDGDSIGSQLAMAFALRALGKDVRVVNRDRPPAPLHGRFPA